MSENNNSWFHCGRCGSLFLSPIGDLETRFCTSCGSNPSLGIEISNNTLRSSQGVAQASVHPIDPTSGRKKIHVRGRSQRNFMLKLTAVWLLILLAIVFVARRFWKPVTDRPSTTKSSEVSSVAVSDEDQILLNKATPLCGMVLGGFLNAKTLEERSQFVSSPIKTTGRMVNFYGTNPLENIDPKTITIQNAAVAHLPGEMAIEFSLGSADGRLLDAAFVQENDEWKIDWDHFVRYSEIPWPLFLAGGGESEGEFRLLARERLADERKNADTISLVLYAPRFGYARETGFQSPEFIVRRNSRDGRLLDAAFKLERSQKRPFGVNLPNVNLEGLIRVRVKIRRETVDQTRRFEIEKVIACHWYANDDPGLIIPEAPSKDEAKSSETKTPEAPASSPEAAPSPETNAETPERPDE